MKARNLRLRGRWGVNLALLMLVVVLGLLAVMRPGKKDPVAKTPLLSLDLNGLSHFTLENGEHLEFERKDGVWRLSQPFSAAVNQSRVDQLLAIPSLIPASAYPLPVPKERGTYGLSEPFARLDLAGAQLAFGGTAPLDHRRYVQSGEMLYLVDDSFSHQLVSKSTDFVDKKLVPEQASIRALKIPGLQISKSDEGLWSSIPALSGESIQDLIMQWSTARAIEVRRGVPKVLGERIELETSAGRLIFSILQKKPELILGREDLDLVFVMTGETSRLLLNEAKQRPMRKSHDDDESPGGDHLQGQHDDE